MIFLILLLKPAVDEETGMTGALVKGGICKGKFFCWILKMMKSYWLCWRL
jgi:hypothetical protein